MIKISGKLEHINDIAIASSSDTDVHCLFVLGD